MRRIMEEKATMSKDFCIKSTKEFVRGINLKHSKLKAIKKEKLKNIVREWDSKRWQKKVTEKSSLSVYKN